MKKYSTALIVAIFAVFVVTGISWSNPINFSFSGNYQLSDNANDIDTFMETLSFDNPDIYVSGYGWISTPGSGYITQFQPSYDTLFNDNGLEYVEIAPLTLDPNNPYYFNPQTYSDGFKVYDDNGTLLFNADLTAKQIIVTSSSGLINSSLEMNLTNIAAGSTYSSGSSAIVDAFLAAPGGATNLTLQVSGDLGAIISNSNGLNGATYNGTYSGSAAPVPEPATIMLLGAGLVGLGGFAKRRRSKKS